MVAKTRRLADEFSKLEEEFKAILAQLESTADPSERTLLLEDLRMLIHLAHRLIRQHDQDVRKLLTKAKLPPLRSSNPASKLHNTKLAV